MTLKKAAQEALDVQNACNLSGVVHSLARVVTMLRALPECTGTEWCNTHPIVYLFVDKLADLSGVPHLDSGRFMQNYEACIKLASASFENCPRCGQHLDGKPCC